MYCCVVVCDVMSVRLVAQEPGSDYEFGESVDKGES